MKAKYILSTLLLLIAENVIFLHAQTKDSYSYGIPQSMWDETFGNGGLLIYVLPEQKTDASL